MTIETTAKSVEQATNLALEQLGLTIDQVTVEVLEKGGLLRKASVRVTANLSNKDKAQKFLTDVVALMGFEGYTVDGTEDENGITLNVTNTTGDESNIIGYRGETLDSLQYLTSLIINEKQGEYHRLVVDSENYREKREKILVQLARNLEKKVKRTGEPVKLEHMNPYERRLIHTTLQNSQYVCTESDGVGNHRHIVISPKMGNDILNAPNRKQPHKFVYSSDKKRRR